MPAELALLTILEGDKLNKSHLCEELFWKFYRYKREDDAWDYKSDISIANKSEFAEFAKDILAFANYGGGYILLGVEDETHKLIGIKQEINPANLGNSIEKKMGFYLDVRLIYFDHQEGDNNIRLGLIHIPTEAKLLMSNYDLHNSKGNIVVQENIPYYRRNTRSIRANSEDIEKIILRMNTGRTGNIVALQDEPSALQRLEPDKLGFYRVLYGKYDPTAKELGKKLWEVWQFTTKHSKHDFAGLLHIPIEDMDDYFAGEKHLNLNHLIAATKMFDLPTDYFFRPSFEMRFAYWKEDLVKYAILSLIKPKSAIHIIDNDGGFFGSILHELATGICDLHNLLYSPEPNISAWLGGMDSNVAWYLKEPIPAKLKDDLGKQYYKLLEQYHQTEDRSLTPQEHILKLWFNASDEYIARLIIEGIDRIDISSKRRYTVKLRFKNDLLKRKVRFRGYDSKNLKLVS